MGAFALLLGVAGCGTPGNGGTNTDSSESGKATASTSAEAAKVDPCKLLTSEDLGKLSLEAPGEVKRISGAPGCDWNLTTSGGLSIVANNDKSIDELNFTDGTVEDTSIAGMRAKLVRELVGPGDCGVSLASSSTTSVTIAATKPRDTEAACQVVQQAAPLVLANLPKS